MPNVAAVLKEEIRRLARKEGKALVGPLKKALAAERKAGAALRKELAAQRRQMASVLSALKRQSVAGVQAISATNATPAAGGKWRKDTVRSTRRQLDLTQANFAKLVGVSQITVSFWETGRSTPRAKQQASVLAARSLSKAQAHKRLGLSTGGSGRGRGRAKKA